MHSQYQEGGRGTPGDLLLTELTSLAGTTAFTQLHLNNSVKELRGSGTEEPLGQILEGNHLQLDAKVGTAHNPNMVNQFHNWCKPIQQCKTE